MKKSKFLKPFSFISLALLMGIAGTMAFAPLGVSPSVASASEMVDQVNTKADGENIKYAPSALGLDPENDPVIYTTESGLEIKFGGSNKLQNGIESIDSGLIGGPLAGYPYITMGTYDGYAVNWVIIGRNTNVSTMSFSSTNYYMDINHYSKHDGLTANQLKSHISDTQTPAGIALNNDGILQDYCGYKMSLNMSLDSIVSNAEIPSGYVLCTTECYLGTSKWSSSDNGGADLFNSAINSRYTSISATITEAEKALIKDNKFFGFSYSSSFKVSTYLTTGALRICYNIANNSAGWWWTNQASSQNYRAYAINPSGAIDGSSGENVIGRDDVYLGIRPCMLLKIT